jgi:hypothetical protein
MNFNFFNGLEQISRVQLSQGDLTFVPPLYRRQIDLMNGGREASEA